MSSNTVSKRRRGLCAVLAGILLTLTMLPISGKAAGFSDVPSGFWASDAISRAIADGITVGYPDGTFKPNNSLTQAQAAAFFVREFFSTQLETYEKAHPNADWAEASMACFYYNFDGKNANDLFTRYDMAMAMSGIMSDKRAHFPDDSKIDAAKYSIADWNRIPEKYRDDVANCYAAGLLNGTSNGTFDGNSGMTRAQACVVLFRLADYIGWTKKDPAPSTSTPAPTPTTPTTTTPGTPNALAVSAHTLPDGRPFTEENVQDYMVTVIQPQFPEGTEWGYGDWYYSKVMGGSDACGGYAYMVSDMLFGELQSFAVTDYNNIRPGDVIIFNKKASSIGQTHAVVAITGVREDGSFIYTDANNPTKDGNRIIRWASPDESFNVKTFDFDTWKNGVGAGVEGVDDVMDLMTIYTRYPN